MFGNLGVHLLQYPSGRFGFVGTLPADLGDAVEASTADVMAGRAERAPNGKLYTVKFPSFETAYDAMCHAKHRRVRLCQNETCACAELRRPHESNIDGCDPR